MWKWIERFMERVNRGERFARAVAAILYWTFAAVVTWLFRGLFRH